MENRHGLAVDGGISLATGTAEWETALQLVASRPRRRRITLGPTRLMTFGSSSPICAATM